MPQHAGTRTASVFLNQQFPASEWRAVDSIAQLNHPKMQFGLANLQWVRKMKRDHQNFLD